ncbi:hypothetical protein RFI_23170 [Reticulomyxa filosa]|uniref:Uncharacterized protein n=1 Tax=Reticulomyxa filosa TaxID=46433 RepID=X6MKM8_RETFI|nr:hypothetical protein RFI_23170 [Reticulomyxa filosa]|eukprot:ETO14201.1 hypothetical protein RFI_23170 [Reticulomyxa filosa]
MHKMDVDAQNPSQCSHLKRKRENDSIIDSNKKMKRLVCSRPSSGSSVSSLVHVKDLTDEHTCLFEPHIANDMPTEETKSEEVPYLQSNGEQEKKEEVYLLESSNESARDAMQIDRKENDQNSNVEKIQKNHKNKTRPLIRNKDKDHTHQRRSDDNSKDSGATNDKNRGHKLDDNDYNYDSELFSSYQKLTFGPCLSGPKRKWKKQIRGVPSSQF